MRRAEAGRDSSALSVMRVWETSRWVSWGRRGSSVSKAELGRVKHSCRLRRLMSSIRVGDSRRLPRNEEKASTNGWDEEAQKSTARSLGRSKKSLWRTLESMSSSKFSWSKTSLITGVRPRHLTSVFAVRFWISEFDCRERPSPTDVKWERSRRRTRVPKPGYSLMWLRNLEKMEECGTVMCLYKVLIVATWIVFEVSRQAIRSTFRGA